MSVKLPTSEDRRPLIEAVRTGQLATSDVRAIVRSVTNEAIEAVVISTDSPPSNSAFHLPPATSATSSHEPAPSPSRMPPPPVDVSIRTVARVNQRTLDRDIQIVRNILVRWRVRMVESDESHEQVRAALEQILIDAHQLTNALARGTGEE